MATFFQRLFGFGGVAARRSSLPLQLAKEKRILLSLERLEDRIAPAQLTVTSAQDPTTPTQGTLRYEINQANMDAAKGTSDTIGFNTAQMGASTITLQQGKLSVGGGSGTVTIDGGDQVTISGNNTSEVFFVAGQAVLSGLTIAQGDANAGTTPLVLPQGVTISPYVYPYYFGPALTGDDGGGIANTGTLTLLNVTLASNSATGSGGGIDNWGTLAMTNCTLSGNSAVAIENWGTLTVTNATVSGNPDGGIGNNSGSFGWGWNSGNAGQIGSVSINSTVTLENTIVAGNGGSDINGSVVSSSAYNLIGNGNGMTGISNGSNNNQVGTGSNPISPLLGPLGNYGGTIQTMALLTGSPAIGKGEAITGITTDERGSPRPSTPDIGAYQTQPAVSLLMSAPASTLAGSSFNVILTAVDANGNVATSFAGAVTLTSSDGESVLTTPNVTLTNGTITISVTLNITHTVTLTAKVGSFVAQSSIIVIPADTASYTVTTPAAVKAGIRFPVTVQAVNNSGKVETGYNGPVTLTSSDGQAVSPATVTLTNGTATVSVTLTNGDVTKLTAAADILTGASNSFLVVAPGMPTYYLGSDGTLWDTKTGKLIDSGVVAFRIDGAGSAVALDSKTTSTIDLSNNQSYTTPSYTLKVFAAGTNNQLAAVNGVTTFVLDGSGSVVYLQVPPAGGQLFSSPLYNLFRLAGSSYTPTSMDSGVRSIAVDGSGAVVALDNLSVIISPPLAEGQVVSTPVYNLELFAPGSKYVKQQMKSSDGAVSTFTKFALDGSGAVFALGQPYFTQVGFSTGQITNTPLAPLIRFAPGSIQGQIAYNNVNTFLVDGAGSVVALAYDLNNSLSQEITLANGQVVNSIVYSLIRFAPGSAKAQTIDSGVSRLTLDGSGSVVALDSLTAGSSGIVGTLQLFPTGSGKAQPLASNVTSFALDGTGSVVALTAGTLIRFAPGSGQLEKMELPPASGSGDAPSKGTITQFVVDGDGSIVALDQTSQNKYLIRFLPGSVPGTLTSHVIDTGVSYFAVDGSGSVVALSGGQLSYFAPGENNAQPVNLTGFFDNSYLSILLGSVDGTPTVSSFVVDGSGSVVASCAVTWQLSTGQILQTNMLIQIAPGLTSAQIMNGPDRQYLANVSSIAVDGSGSVVALTSSGSLIRFAPGSTASTEMAPNHKVSTFVVDGSGSVIALDSIEEKLGRFAPGSDQSSPLDDNNTVTKVTELGVDSSGTVVALDNSTNIPGQPTFWGDLIAFPAGSTHHELVDQFVQSFVVDASGSVVAVDNVVQMEPNGLPAFTLERFAPGLLDAHGFPVMQYMNLANVSRLAVDAKGWVVAQSGSTLAFFEPGSSTFPIEYPNVESFVVDAAGYVWLVELYQGEESLFMVTPGLPGGILVYKDVAHYPNAPSMPQFAVDGSGYVVVGINVEVNGNVQTDLIRFTPGTTNLTYLDTNGVQYFAVDTKGFVIALELNGNLVRFAPGSSNSSLPQIIPNINFTVTFGSSTLVSIPCTFWNFFIEQNGDIIAIDHAYNTTYNVDNYFLFYITPGSNELNSLITNPNGGPVLLQFGVVNQPSEIQYGVNFTSLQTGTMLVAVSEGSGRLYIIPPSSQSGQYAPYMYEVPPVPSLPPGPTNPLGPARVQNFQINGSTVTVNGGSFSRAEIPVEIMEIVGAALIAYFSGGTGTPLLVQVLVAAATAAAEQEINHLAFNTPFSWTSVLTAGLTAGVTGAVAGAAGDATSGLFDGVSDSDFNTGDLSDLVDPATTEGGLLQTIVSGTVTSFTKDFLNNLLSGQPIGQAAANAGLTSLENAAEGGLLDSTFFQDTTTYLDISEGLSDTPLDTSFTEDALSLDSEMVSNDLTDSLFGQEAMSLIVNTAANLLTGKPVFQGALSILGAVVANGLADTAFGEGVASFADQTVVDGLGDSNLTADAATLLNDVIGDNLGDTPFGSYVGQFLSQIASGSSLEQAGLSVLGQVVNNNLGDTTFGNYVGQFVDQVASGSSLGQAGLSLLGQVITNNLGNTPFGNEVGQFLDQVASGSSFGQAGLSVLEQIVSNSLAGLPFAGDVGQFLDQASAGTATVFDNNALPLLSQLAGSVGLANTPFAGEVGQFLNEVGTSVATTFDNNALLVLTQLASSSSLAASTLARNAGSFIDEIASSTSLASSSFALNGVAFLTEIVSSPALENSTLAQYGAAFLNQVISSGLATSTFADSAASFLQQAVAASQTSSDFAQGAFTLLDGVDSANLTNMVQSIKLATNNTIDARFQANTSGDADAILNFVNQLPSYNNSPMTVTLNLANGASAIGVTANPPPGVTLIINGPSGTTTLVGHWNVTTSASNVSAVYNPNTQTVSLSAAVAVTGEPSAQVNEGTVTFTVKNGQTVIATVQGTVSGGKASGSFSLPAGQAQGNYTIAVSYSNSQGNIVDSGNSNAILTVQTPPTISSGNNAVFTVGQGGSFTVTATGTPTPTLTESGALPSGIAFKDNGNGTATLRGAPTASGTYHFAITAQNGAGDFTQNFTLTVIPSPTPPPPAPPNVPSLLALFNEFLGGLETVNANGTTITDNLFGLPLVETFDYFGNLVSVTLLGFNITFLFG